MKGLCLFVKISILIILWITSSNGKVLELDERFLNVEKEGMWLIMFYAPWCGHCKQLEPTWVEVGEMLHQQTSDVKVARVDATMYSSVASHYEIHGFPTILFFKNGHRIDYDGARTVDSIVSFVYRAKGPEVTLMHDRDSFLRTRNALEVFFLYVGEDTPLKLMYFKVAQSVFTTINLFSTSKSILPNDISISHDTTVLVFKDGKHYEAPSNIPDIEVLEIWLRREQFPSYNHLTGSSYHSLVGAGKRFAIAVTEKDHLLNATLQEIALERTYLYTFCWVEGNSVVNQMTYDTISLPNVVVYDTKSHEYFVLSDKEDFLPDFSKEHVEKFFQNINDGKIAAKGGHSAGEQAKRAVGNFAGFFLDLFSKHPIIAALIIVIPTILISGFCFCLCSIDESEVDSWDDDDTDFDEKIKDLDENIEDFDVGNINDTGDGAAIEGLRQRLKKELGAEVD